MRIIFLLLISMTSLLRSDRSVQPQYVGYAEQGFVPAYSFNQPDTVLQLGAKLNEISGLCYNESRDVLLTMNDEKGKMYSLNKVTGKILKSSDIGKNGDYEGIATIRDTAYITKSNGKITVFDLINSRVIKVIDNELNVNNDIEGLVIAPNGTLILACKAKGLKKQSNPDLNYLYSLDTNSTKGVTEFIDMDVRKATKTLESFGIEDSNYPYFLKKRFSRLYPSGIAFDNDNKLLYVLSAKNNIIAVINLSTKRIVALLGLDPIVHKQAEGITFDSDGRLYISNEAAGGTAVINVYNPL